MEIRELSKVEVMEVSGGEGFCRTAVRGYYAVLGGMLGGPLGAWGGSMVGHWVGGRICPALP